MNAIWKWLTASAAAFSIASNTFATSPYAPITAPRAVPKPTPTATEEIADEQQLRPLLDKLSELSQAIDRNAQSPQVWQYHLEQAEVLLRLAAQSRQKEREDILHMAVDASSSAALLCPREQPIGLQRLRELPSRLTQYFPGSPAILYSILQGIEADCTLELEKTGGDKVKAEDYRCKRLLQFAQQHTEFPEAAKAVLQAAHIRESLGQNEEACRCYRLLVERFPNDPAARKAGGALWRLGDNHQPISLELPLLYGAAGSGTATFQLDELRGRLVVVYFWSSTSERVEEDFQQLKQMTDRYAGRGLEVVYVNMDSDGAKARGFLSGRLTSGVHVHQPGGLEGAVAEQYGIQSLPQIFLVGRDGTLMKHSLTMDRLEAEIANQLPRRR
jgi:thiol-disulfide isomerase/thioredoxin